MNEIKNILELKEKIIYETKPEYAPYIIFAGVGAFILSVFLAVFIGAIFRSFIAGIIIFIFIFTIIIVLANMMYKRIFYTITNKRVIIQSGLIGRDFKSIDYDRMQNFSVDVDVIGVIFKVGNIKIFTGEMTSAGKHGGIVSKYDRFNYVTTPYEVLKKLQTQSSARKEKVR